MIFTPSKKIRKEENWPKVTIGPSYNLKNAKKWCRANYPANRWYFWFGNNSFWFDDPAIATEFALRYIGT